MVKVNRHAKRRAEKCGPVWCETLFPAGIEVGMPTGFALVRVGNEIWPAHTMPELQVIDPRAIVLDDEGAVLYNPLTNPHMPERAAIGQWFASPAGERWRLRCLNLPRKSHHPERMIEMAATGHVLWAGDACDCGEALRFFGVAVG